MADRSLAIRLAVIDGGKVKAELRDVGEAGSRSLKRIEDAAQPARSAANWKGWPGGWDRWEQGWRASARPVLVGRPQLPVECADRGTI
jgi:hypothetical protein